MSRNEWQDMLLSGARHATEPTIYLADCRAVPPRPGQQRILQYVVTLAEQALGSLGNFEVIWRVAGHDHPRAQTTGGGNGRSERIVVDVRCDLVGPELGELLFHEVCHVAQLASGRWDTLSRQERETEAVRFAGRAMRGELL